MYFESSTHSYENFENPFSTPNREAVATGVPDDDDGFSRYLPLREEDSDEASVTMLAYLMGNLPMSGIDSTLCDHEAFSQYFDQSPYNFQSDWDSPATLFNSPSESLFQSDIFPSPTLTGLSIDSAIEPVSPFTSSPSSSPPPGSECAPVVWCNQDPRGLEDASASCQQRRLSHEPSVLSATGCGALSWAPAPVAECISPEGAHEGLVPSSFISPMPTDGMRDVELLEMRSDDGSGPWDGYRKEGKKWVCETCGKGVANRKSDLVRHCATHGEKQFRCTKEKCGKLYSRRDALSRHMKSCGLGLKRGPKPGRGRKRARRASQ